MSRIAAELGEALDRARAIRAGIASRDWRQALACAFKGHFWINVIEPDQVTGQVRPLKHEGKMWVNLVEPPGEDARIKSFCLHCGASEP